MQFTRDYTIKKNGRLSARSTKSINCPIEARKIQVYSKDGVMMHDEKFFDRRTK
nr:MAG TPA: hypothetical protein [Caudoviricetes sp.]